MNKQIIKSALVTAGVIALVFRIPAIKNVVVGEFN